MKIIKKSQLINQFILCININKNKKYKVSIFKFISRVVKLRFKNIYILFFLIKKRIHVVMSIIFILQESKK